MTPRSVIPIDKNWEFKQADKEGSEYLPVSQFPTNVHLDLLAHSAMKMRPEAKVTDDLVQALTRTGSAESMAFLPRLKKLTIRSLNYDNFPTERLRDAMGRMLDSRLNTALVEGSDPKLETLKEVSTDCECRYLVGLSDALRQRK